MNTFVFALTAFRRDWRAGEMRLIAIAVIVAVASVTSVSFFTDRVKKATQTQATQLLAADLVLESRLPIPEHIITTAKDLGLVTSNIISMRSMVIANDQLQMAEIKAVDDSYPIRGQLKTSNGLFDEETISTSIPGSGSVWVDSRLFQTLNLEIGSRLNIGASQLTVSKVLTYEPDRGGDMFNMAPRLMMNLADIHATNLILPASRVEYRFLVGGESPLIQKFRQTINQGTDLRIQGIRDARPELRSALERAEQFLGLAVLVSIALAGLAVALSAQQYVIRHFDNCAIMRCLGAVQDTINKIYITQLLILSIGSSLIGCAVGFIAQHALAYMLTGMSNTQLPDASLFPIAYGLMAGVITVMGFALPQVLRLKNVAPLRVFRRDLNPLPLSSMSCYSAAILCLALLTPWQSGNIKLTGLSFIGILLTAILLTVGAFLMIKALNSFRARAGFALRFGLANIVRRANLSIAQILGIGLGIMVMLLLTLVRTDLLDSWQDRIPEGTPNYFLINIQDTDVPQVQTFLGNENQTSTALYPMIRGRLSAINSEKIVAENFTTAEARRWARRAYNLSFSQELPSANSLTAGEWWDIDNIDTNQLSLEEEFANELGVTLNDTLTFMVAGKEVSGKISSLRKVDWDSFNVNFFVLASPGMLDDYPASYVTSFYLPTEKKNIIIDLVKRFPSVTVFDVDDLINEVRKIMDQVVSTVEFVFGFTILAGIVVLISALQTTHSERSYESALLSSLGASRRQIRLGLIMEFLCIGVIAGFLAALSASFVELLLAKFVFNLDVTIDYRLWIVAPVICTAIIITVGLAGTRRVLFTPPIQALKEF
jgi:putative ABC transport system permease protein